MTGPGPDHDRPSRRAAVTELELKSQLYGWLGDRTADPDGDEWQHEPLQQLVHDLLALPELAALRAKADA